MRERTMSGVVRDSPCPQTSPSQTTMMSFRSSAYCVSARDEIVPSRLASPSEYAVTMRIVYSCVARAVAEDQFSNLTGCADFLRMLFCGLVGVASGDAHRSTKGST